MSSYFGASAPKSGEPAPQSTYDQLFGASAPAPAGEPAPQSTYDQIFGASAPASAGEPGSISTYEQVFGAPSPAPVFGELPGRLHGTWQMDRIEPEAEFDAFLEELGFSIVTRQLLIAMVGGKFLFYSEDGGATAVITECGVIEEFTQRVPLNGTRHEFLSRTGCPVALVATTDDNRIYVREERGSGETAVVMSHVFSCVGDEARRTTTSKGGHSFDQVFRRLPS